MAKTFDENSGLVYSLYLDFGVSAEEAVLWLNENIVPELANAVDDGISIAGRYGHEDSWDDNWNDPYRRNPWRDTEDDDE